MDNINVNTERFKQNLADLINKSGLPVANVYFVFQSVEKELEDSYYSIVNNELRKEQATAATQPMSETESSENASESKD